MAPEGIRFTMTPYLNNCSKLFLNYIVYMFLIYVICGVSKACRFPRYLETNGNMWIAKYSETTLKGYFRGNLLTASRCDQKNDCFEYQRRCLVKRENDKYEVQHNSKTGSNPPMFLCMQILQRGTSIIQIRESSELHYRSPNACNDNHLILDNWPMLTIDNFSSQKIPCPFSGGYHIRFQNSEKQPKCDKVINPARLESECEQGDGMNINFLERECLEKGLEMSVQQSLFCAASWTHSNYTFVILRPQNGEFKAWCMRITEIDMSQPIKKGILFVDLVCDPGDGSGTIRETSNYVHLEFERRVISSTCADAYSTTCSDRRLCNNNENYNQNCRKFCDYCHGEPASCTFPAALQGDWVENQNRVQSEIQVSWYDMDISNIGRFKCHEQDGHDFENNTMLVQTFDNGCFPRYACFQSKKLSSSILEYRLGNRVRWPVKNFDKLKDEVCSDSQFDPNDKDKEMFGKNIDEKPHKILVDMHHHYPVNCELNKWPGFKDSRLYMQEVNVCEYCLVHDSDKRDAQNKIVTQQINCTGDGILERKDYHCLGAFPQDDNTHAVVTRTLHVHQEYLCWVFVREVDNDERSGIVYVLDATNCNRVAINAMREGNFEPKKTFIIPKRQTRSCPYLGPLFTTPMTPYEHTPSQKRPPINNDNSDDDPEEPDDPDFYPVPKITPYYNNASPENTGRPYPQQHTSLIPPFLSRSSASKVTSGFLTFLALIILPVLFT